MNNSRAVSPSPAFNRVALPETTTLTHSGGTAPVSHRTSLLCPCGHLRLTVSLNECSDCKYHSDGFRTTSPPTGMAAALCSLFRTNNARERSWAL